MLLIKFDSDWADEFGVDGFTIMPERDWKFIEEVVKIRFEARPGKTVDWYFGTNEGFDWYDYEEMMSCFSVKTITGSEAAVIDKFFSVDPHKQYTSFGHIPFYSCKEDVLELVEIWEEGHIEMDNGKPVWKDERDEKNEKTT